MQQAFQEWILSAGKIEILFQIKFAAKKLFSIADWRLQIADFRLHELTTETGLDFLFLIYLNLAIWNLEFFRVAFEI